jgi:hypothetical protein
MVALTDADSSIAQSSYSGSLAAANKATSGGLADPDTLAPRLEGDDAVEIRILGLAIHGDRLRLEAITHIIQRREES